MYEVQQKQLQSHIQDIITPYANTAAKQLDRNRPEGPSGIWVTNVPASHILGGYYQQDSQQMQGSDPSLLFDTWEVTSGVLFPVLGLFKKGTDILQWVQQRCTKMVRGWSTWCRRGGAKNWTCTTLILEDLQEEHVVSNDQMGLYRDSRAWLWAQSAQQ